jgi:hypothetical protein
LLLLIFYVDLNVFYNNLFKIKKTIMKRYFDLKVLTSLLAITILFAYCKKGDSGATGAAGAAGAAGATGSQGPKGDTGTANVIYSEWLSVAFAPDTTHTGSTIDTLGYFADIAAAKLDTNILNRGEIKVYFNENTNISPAVFPLPYYDGSVSISTLFLPDHIQLFSNIDVSSFKSGDSTYFQYRYILIPGGTSGKRAEPNWKDYNAVKAFYNIKD